MLLEKLKKALGEELSKQVEEKLNGIELAIMNDGSVVPADKHDTLKKEHSELQTQYKTEIDGLNTKLEDALKTSGDVDAFKKTIEDLKVVQQKSVDAYEVKIKGIEINSALEIALTKASVKNSRAVKALLDMDSIQLENGELKGINEQIETLQKSDGYLFGEIIPQGQNPQQGNNPPLDPSDYTTRYQEAIKVGNNREAIKIKQEAFREGTII